MAQIFSTTTTLHTLDYNSARTWLIATLFVVGNILLPQICHLVPNGGHIFLPIYFFTLVAAYKYGWRAGLLTAIASPIVNHLLFGMPSAEVLPSIELKSILLAGAAGIAAMQFKKVSILILLAVVLFYQIVGSAIEAAMMGSIAAGLVDFKLGLPGMAAQVVLGYLTIKALK